MKLVSISTLLVTLLGGVGHAWADHWEDGWTEDTAPETLRAELRVLADGTIVADLEPTATGLDPSMALYATVPIQDGSSAVVPMSYDHAGGCWRGHAPDHASIVPGRVTLRVAGSNRIIDGRFQAGQPYFGAAPTRVSAGPYPLDVVVLADGRIQAQVADASIPIEQLYGSQVQLGVAVGGSQEIVLLSFDPARRCYLGRTHAAYARRSWRPSFARVLPVRAPFVRVAPRFVRPRVVLPRRVPAPPAYGIGRPVRVRSFVTDRDRRDDRFDRRDRRHRSRFDRDR